VRSFARAVALVAAVASVVAVADPASRPTVGRAALFAIAIAAAVSLVTRVARVVPGAGVSRFEPRAGSAATLEVPVELARLTTSFLALRPGEPLDARLRTTLRQVAASRLQHHGLTLDAPENTDAVTRLLGEPLVAALQQRTAPTDPDHLLAPLEAL
jgi:hypothetical protein